VTGGFVAASTILADGDNAFGAGFIAFVVVVALCVACYFLFRSMNRHLKGLPTKFPQPPDEQTETTEPAAETSAPTEP
jgi:hypothetical protein